MGSDIAHLSLESIPCGRVGAYTTPSTARRTLVDSSIFVFGIDLVDEGVDALIESVRDRAGVDGITLAAAYHHARDFFPHNPNRKVYFHEGGTVMFRPDLKRYGVLQPVQASMLGGRDLLDLATRSGHHSGARVAAWVVYLHNTRLGEQHPEHAPLTVFGDRLVTELCPSDPAVREYVRALTADVARYEVDSIMAEALHFKTIDHGYHHERSFVELGDTSRFLLGLCFCDACKRNAEAGGVDVGAVRSDVAAALSMAFEGADQMNPELDREAVCAMANGEMEGYLASREASVTSLVAEAASIARASNVRFTFSAHGGSAKRGRTTSTDSPDTSWVLGVDLAAAVSAADELEVLGYVADTADLAPLIAGYTKVARPERFAIGLRPMMPDTQSPVDLQHRVRIASDSGASRVDFYHYALMPARNLDWIRSALDQLH